MFKTTLIRLFGPRTGNLELFIAKSLQQEVKKNPHTWTCNYVERTYGPKALRWYKREIYKYIYYSQYHDVVKIPAYARVPFRHICNITGRTPIEERAIFVEYLVDRCNFYVGNRDKYS